MGAGGDEPKLMRIGDAAEAAGVSRSSLQYYLMVGLIEPTERGAGGQQFFDAEAVKRIQLVRELNESGYPLREIREIFLQRDTQQRAEKKAEEKP